jgi:hypothetical protein
MIMQYWFNKYEKENFQEVHSHFGLPQKIRDRLFYPTFSAIYILHSEEKKELNFIHGRRSRDTFSPYIRQN